LHIRHTYTWLETRSLNKVTQYFLFAQPSQYMSHYTVLYTYDKRACSLGGLFYFYFILVFYWGAFSIKQFHTRMLNIRWSEPTRHLPPRWLSIISYHQALVEHLFLLYLILFYFKTYVPGFPVVVEETSLQILQLPKKRHVS